MACRITQLGDLLFVGTSRVRVTPETRRSSQQFAIVMSACSWPKAPVRDVSGSERLCERVLSTHSGRSTPQQHNVRFVLVCGPSGKCCEGAPRRMFVHTHRARWSCLSTGSHVPNPAGGHGRVHGYGRSITGTGMEELVVAPFPSSP